MTLEIFVKLDNSENVCPQASLYALLSFSKYLVSIKLGLSWTYPAGASLVAPPKGTPTLHYRALLLMTTPHGQGVPGYPL